MVQETEVQSQVESYQRLKKIDKKKNKWINRNKKVLDVTLLTLNIKVRNKGKVDPSRKWSGTLPNTSVKSLLKSEPLGHPQLWSLTLLSNTEKLLLKI